MKAGIKVGPRDWQQTLNQVKVPCLEVWFRLDWEKEYFGLFKYLQKNRIEFGLHFWAMVEGKYFPNLLSPEKRIAQKSLKLIKQTIDIAAKWQAKYVNFHPESYREVLLDLDHSKIKVIDPKETFDREKSFAQFLIYLKDIKKYADQKGIIPLVETVPKYAPSDFEDIKKGRLKPEKTEGMETEKYERLVKMGYPICLDIEHTMSQIITNDREEVFTYLMKSAKKLRKKVGLIHICTKIPPFNGTDSHNGVLAEDFAQGVVPNKKQLIEFLRLFKDKDVWLIPEPHEKMIENHLALKKMIFSF